MQMTVIKIFKCAINVVLIGGALFAKMSWGALPIEHVKLQGGLEVYWVNVQSLPMVDIQIDFDAGARRDPPSKVGLSSVVAMMLNKGVLAQGKNPALDENAIGQAWADWGAVFMASAGDDRMSIYIRSLSQEAVLSQVMKMAFREITTPAFNANIWSREKTRLLSDLKESLTQPAPVAARAFKAAVMQDHPYARAMSEASIKRIQVNDMKAFHANHLGACQTKISMVGALSRERVLSLAKDLALQLKASASCAEPTSTSTMGAPQGARTAAQSFGEVKPLARAERVNIAFNSAQSHVLIGQPGIERADPRYFPLTVGNYILGGGGFVSRLTEQVREKRGLSYSVYSYFAPALQAGPFTIGLQTRGDQTEEALKVVQNVLEEFVTDGPSEQELQAAKDNLIGGFALRIDSNKKLLDNVANIAWYHLPLDYLQTWTQEVQRVSVQDIHQAFKGLIDPKKMATVVVGVKP
jgi:zinc protease